MELSFCSFIISLSGIFFNKGLISLEDQNQTAPVLNAFSQYLNNSSNETETKIHLLDEIRKSTSNIEGGRLDVKEVNETYKNIINMGLYPYGGIAEYLARIPNETPITTLAAFKQSILKDLSKNQVRNSCSSKKATSGLSALSIEKLSDYLWPIFIQGRTKNINLKDKKREGRTKNRNLKDKKREVEFLRRSKRQAGFSDSEDEEDYYQEVHHDVQAMPPQFLDLSEDLASSSRGQLKLANPSFPSAPAVSKPESNAPKYFWGIDELQEHREELQSAMPTNPHRRVSDNIDSILDKNYVSPDSSLMPVGFDLIEDLPSSSNVANPGHNPNSHHRTNEEYQHVFDLLSPPRNEPIDVDVHALIGAYTDEEWQQLLKIPVSQQYKVPKYFWNIEELREHREELQSPMSTSPHRRVSGNIDSNLETAYDFHHDVPVMPVGFDSIEDLPSSSNVANPRHSDSNIQPITTNEWPNYLNSPSFQENNPNAHHRTNEEYQHAFNLLSPPRNEPNYFDVDTLISALTDEEWQQILQIPAPQQSNDPKYSWEIPELQKIRADLLARVGSSPHQGSNDNIYPFPTHHFPKWYGK